MSKKRRFNPAHIVNAVLCYGMYKDVVTHGTMKYGVKFLYDKEPAVNAYMEALWCIEKQRQITHFVQTDCNERTIGIRDYRQVTSRSNYMSTACEKVTQINAFRKMHVALVGRCYISKTDPPPHPSLGF